MEEEEKEEEGEEEKEKGGGGRRRRKEEGVYCSTHPTSSFMLPSLDNLTDPHQRTNVHDFSRHLFSRQNWTFRQTPKLRRERDKGLWQLASDRPSLVLCI